MIKKFFLLSLSLWISLWGCKNDQPSSESLTVREDSTLMEQLSARAVDENDISGRLKPTATVLMEEFTRSEKTMPGLKNVQVTIDADCVLTISNEASGKEVTRVNLQDLDPAGFSLIPDLNEGDFPGLRIQTKENKDLVAFSKDGELVRKKPELVIYMADRQAIERITPYMLQALNICQGVQYPD